MKTHNLLFLPVLFLFGSCIKDDVKLPEEPEALNTEMSNGFPADGEICSGYMYSCYSQDPNASYLFAYCTFRDPGADLFATYDHFTDQTRFFTGEQINGNIRVGNVRFNKRNLVETNSGGGISYRLTNTNNISLGDGSALWETDGNGSFKSLADAINRGFPKILYSTVTKTASISSDYIIETKNIATNFDSLIISIGYYNYQIRKRAVAGDQIIKFTKEELYSKGAGTQNLYIYAYNYSHRIINSKKYVFELANKYTTILQIVN